MELLELPLAHFASVVNKTTVTMMKAMYISRMEWRMRRSDVLLSEKKELANRLAGQSAIVAMVKEMNASEINASGSEVKASGSRTWTEGGAVVGSLPAAHSGARVIASETEEREKSCAIFKPLAGAGAVQQSSKSSSSYVQDRARCDSLNSALQYVQYVSPQTDMARNEGGGIVSSYPDAPTARAEAQKAMQATLHHMDLVAKLAARHRPETAAEKLDKLPNINAYLDATLCLATSKNELQRRKNQQLLTGMIRPMSSVSSVGSRPKPMTSKPGTGFSSLHGSTIRNEVQMAALDIASPSADVLHVHKYNSFLHLNFQYHFPDLSSTVFYFNL